MATDVYQKKIDMQQLKSQEVSKPKMTLAMQSRDNIESLVENKGNGSAFLTDNNTESILMIKQSVETMNVQQDMLQNEQEF